MFKNHQITILDSTQNRWLLVGLSALFGTVFMFIYDPLTIKTIIIHSWLGRFLTVNASAIVGGLTVAFSQLVLRPFFKIDSFKVSTFIPWLALEMFLISIVIFVIFKETQEPNWVEYLLVTKYAVAIALPPYLLACFILLFKEARSPTKVAPYTDVDSSSAASISNKYWTIKNTRGVERLIVKSENLLYIEAKNNYIEVSYLEGENVKKKLIRNTLKNLEADPTGPTLFRVHRSYMINLDNISNIERRGAKLSVILTHLEDIEIPVSNSYQKPIEDAMSGTQDQTIHP